MDAHTIVGYFRDEAVDVEEPYLWSDNLVLQYLNDAQIALARDTEGIEDQMTLTLPANTNLITLDRRILKIRSARSDRGVLELSSPERTARWRPATGQPKVLVVRSRTKVEPWPVPTEDTAITLDVFRLPKSDVLDMGDELEVDDIHKMGLLHYMMYRAYSRPDPETLDRTRASFFRDEFAAYCREAKKEQGRRRKSEGATTFSW